MKFEYKLLGAGWANFNIQINSQSFSFSPGYLTDALGGLLNAIKIIHPVFDTEGDYKEGGSYYFWDAEPDRLDWNFKYIDNENIHVNLTYFEDDEGDGVVVLNQECPYDVFLKEVLREVELILLEFGIVGYKEMWCENEFPLSTFLELKHYLVNKKRFPIVTNILANKEEKKSDLKFEIDFINKINLCN
ncbi:hypothetical protein [Bacillus sp. AFS029533]|uniref:hypothetical protein n=1 Tax=Bacillus sp. AFS029533 TaxID=2033494 RepID=UPI000BFD02D0|nr:hypothetical protein [Bacillus sp. AFS029533]PGZ90923.1 hypothetical protein COE53_16425 [Bacillus sp. AFS029533]